MLSSDSLAKTLMLGKIEDCKRRVQQKMRWLDGIIDSMDLRLSKLQELVMDREAQRAAVHGVTKRWTWQQLNWTDWGDHMVFILQFANMMYHIDWFTYVKKILGSLIKSHWIRVCNPFNVLLESVCSILLRIFSSMFIYDIGTSFSFADILVWFWYPGYSGLIEWAWECPFLWNFLERFERIVLTHF